MTPRLLGPALPLLALACCAGEPAETPVTALEPLSKHRLTDIEEPSGLSFANGRLYAVSDQEAEVYVLSADGALTETVSLDLPAGEREGLEAVSVLGDTVAVAREDTGEVIRADLPDGRVLARFSLPDAVDGNSGIEGLAVRPADGHVFALKEKKPKLLFHLSEQGTELSRVRLKGPADLSGLTWLCPGRLLALAQEDRAVYELSEEGELRQGWTIPAQHAEGIAHDGSGRLYVVDEEEELLLVFELVPSC